MKKKYYNAVEYFNKDKNREDGLGCWCKECMRNIAKEYREKFKNRKESEISYPKKKKCPHCNKIKFAKEFSKSKGKGDGLNSWCKICLNGAKRKSEWLHSREYKKEINKSLKNRRKNDINFKILCNLRRGLHRAFKFQNIKKTNHTIELIGCDIEKFLEYLEFSFLSGMTFKNYGCGHKEWCIDHIKPCAAFDLTKEKERRKCFHYANLQPMWNKDNWSKNSRYNGKLIRKNITNNI